MIHARVDHMRPRLSNAFIKERARERQGRIRRQPTHRTPRYFDYLPLSLVNETRLFRAELRRRWRLKLNEVLFADQGAKMP